MSQSAYQLRDTIEAKIKALEQEKEKVSTYDKLGTYEIAISNLYIALAKINQYTQS